MDIKRIDGIKYDLDRLSDGELRSINSHLLERHARLTGEIALIEEVLFARAHTELPFEVDLNVYGEVADGLGQ